MANLEWGISTSQGSASEAGPAVPDAQMDRFLNYVWHNFPPADQDGNPLPRTAANEVKAWRLWAGQHWNQIKQQVIEWERTQAAKAAKNAVGEIEES